MADWAEVAPLSCEEIEESHAAYVWGGLEPQEKARFDAHRRECAACDASLRASEQVIAELDQAAPMVPPPPELRARVLGAVADVAAERTAEVRPATPSGVPPARRLQAESSHARSGVDRVSSRGAGQTHRRSRPFFAGLATGVASTLAALAVAVVLVSRPEVLGVLPAVGSQFNQDAPGQVQWPQFALPGSSASSGQRLLELRSPSAPGRGLLAYDAQTGRGVLMLQELDAPASTEYTVWLVRGSQRVALGTVQIDGQGFGTFVLPQPLPLDEAERIEVTPASGDPAAPVWSASF